MYNIWPQEYVSFFLLTCKMLNKQKQTETFQLDKLTEGEHDLGILNLMD